MALEFGPHPDVVFKGAPLLSVLCQIRFAPVMSLLDRAGVAGFSEALRRDYEELEEGAATAIEMTAQGAELRQSAPVWRVTSPDGGWQVSVAVDFIAMQTTAYTHFGEFGARFSHILDVLDRTIHPGRSQRIGLRKVNSIERDVSNAEQWSEFLRMELLGLAGASLDGTIAKDYSEFHISDGEGGTLTVRHGLDQESVKRYLLDLDYWTTKSMSDRGAIVKLLDEYAVGITSFFHWCLRPPLYAALEPVPRSDWLIQ